MAVGLWDPESPIRIKVLHHGAPRTIDESFWQERIGAAVALRQGLAERGDTDAYRVVHGENDGLPGLVVDRYASISVVKLYSAAWFPHLGSVLEAITSCGRHRVERRCGWVETSRRVRPSAWPTATRCRVPECRRRSMWSNTD